MNNIEILSLGELKVLRAINESAGDTIKSKIAKDSDLTYSHVCDCLKYMLKTDLVEEMKYGRCVIVKLTLRGKKVCALYDAASKLLKGGVVGEI